MIHQDGEGLLVLQTVLSVVTPVNSTLKAFSRRAHGALSPQIEILEQLHSILLSNTFLYTRGGL